MIIDGSKSQVWLIADSFYPSEVADIARCYFRHHPSRKICMVKVFPRFSASCPEEDSCHFIVNSDLTFRVQYISRRYIKEKYIYRFSPDYE